MVKSTDEKELETVARKLLATPHKARDESKIGKRISKVTKSPNRKKKPSR